MNHNQKLAYYYFILALCSSSFIALLSVLLFFICRKKPHREFADDRPLSAAKPCARSYTLIDIDTATEGFSHRRVIGEGRLGTVYVALSETGELVAVKRIYPWLVLSNSAGIGFCSVIKSLSSAQHPHLVPIIGCSEAPGERIIVMEYAGVVNLDMYLHQNPDGGFVLNWSHRLKIAAGAARGLQYLHESMAPAVAHGCVKPSNILIDTKFRAKLTDYGLNFLGGREKRGLVGYVDEDYWKSGKGSRHGSCKENDVYGFGVVLLELLSGRGCEEGRLVKWALPLIKEMRFTELLDPRIVCPSDHSDLKPLMRLAKVALACVGNCRNSRPVIGQVVAILNNLEMEVCN